MSIFSTLRGYASKWQVKGSRNFTAEEISEVMKAEVVPSQYGNSVCFYMKAGGQKYIPLSNDANAKVGDTINLGNASLITLGRDGEADIVRVKA